VRVLSNWLLSGPPNHRRKAYGFDPRDPLHL